MNSVGTALVDAVSEIADPIYLVKARHGLFVVNRHDFFLGYAIMRYGEYGEIEGRYLVGLLQPGMNVVEAGANIGTHTVSLAKQIGPRGRLIAIEAQPVIHQNLCANIALNGLMNVTAHACGCGAREEVLFLPPINYGAARRTNFGGVSLDRTEQPGGVAVPVRTLDALVGDLHVHLIKLDVEGMEGDVLAGAAQTIARCRPMLYVENDRLEKSEALIRQIMALDYRLWWDIPHLFNPDNYFGVADNEYGRLASFNMLCLPRGGSIGINGKSEITDPAAHPLRPVAAPPPDRHE